MTAEAGLIAARVLHIFALMILFGLPAFALYAGGACPVSARSRVRRTALWAAAVALLGGVLWFAFTAAAMTGSLAGAVDGRTLSLVAFGTGFGRLWLVRLSLNLLLIVLFLRREDSPPLVHTRIALGGLLLASLAWAGHGTQGEGWPGALHRAGDALHLLAGGIWVGALVLLAAFLVRAKTTRANAKPAHDLLLRFSGIGVGIVTVLLLTGILNARFLMEAQFPMQLFLGRYGQVLAAKIVLFAAMLMLAAGNRYWWTPRLSAALTANADTARALSLLKASVVVETLLAFGVIAAVGWLGTLPPMPE